jgi:hypothetical protein
VKKHKFRWLKTHPISQTTNDPITMNEQNKHSFLHRLLTESTIHDRHRQRRRRDNAMQLSHSSTSSRPQQQQRVPNAATLLLHLPQKERSGKFMVTGPSYDYNSETKLTDDDFSSFNSESTILHKEKNVVMFPHIIFASAIGVAVSELLLGSRPTFQSIRSIDFYTSSYINTVSTTVTILPQKSVMSRSIMDLIPQLPSFSSGRSQFSSDVQNRANLSHLIRSSASTSLLFGVKYGCQAWQADCSNGILEDGGLLSSVIAGMIRASLIPRFLWGYSSRTALYSREISGTVVYFGTYDALKSALPGAPWIAGAFAGAIHTGCLALIERTTTNTILIRSMLRAMPVHAVLFGTYEIILQVSLTSARSKELRCLECKTVLGHQFFT